MSDTGPILHLAEAEALGLFRHLAPILIPPAVDAEMLALRPDWPSLRPKCIVVEHLTPRHNEEAREWFAADILGPGEAEAVALARQINARWLLSDDAAAVLFARSLGVEVHGSLGVVLWCVAKDHLSGADGRAVLQRIRESSLWVSNRVMQEAFSALAQLDSHE